MAIGIILMGYPSGHVSAVTTIGANISTGGSLTADGALKFTSGAANNYILSTDASGNATWISVGTALGNSNTDNLPEGATNKYYSDTAVDSRISAQKGIASGLATLDSTGKVPSGQLPSIALNNSYAAADIAARDALTPAPGDVAIVADDGSGASRSYVWDGAGSAWLELLSPLSLYLNKANNLSDLSDIGAARTNLGLGNVTNDAQIAKSIGAAKGDLIAYSNSGNPVNLPVGTNGQILMADESSAAGVKWTTLAPAINTGIMMLAGNSNNTTVGSANYFPISGTSSGFTSSLQAVSRNVMSHAGTIKNLYVILSTPLAAGKTGTLAVLKNGIETGLTVSINELSSNYADTAHSFTVVAGDEVSIKIVTTGAGSTKYSWAVDFTN